MKVIFQDKDIVVVNKSYNYAVYPSKTWKGLSITDYLKENGIKIKTSGEENRQGVVHRLDVGTSGLLVLAKNEKSYQSLIKQFKNREVVKKYYALVQGYVEPLEAEINLPISRKSGTFKFEVHKNGKNAITKYKVINHINNCSFLDVRLLTGRTHQIRVHFSYLKHPLVGDLIYGANPTTKEQFKLKRHFLHSYYLSFKHPLTNKKIKFEIDLPDDLQKIINKNNYLNNK